MAKTWKRLRDVVTVANDGDQISQFTFDANDYLKVVFFIKKEGTGDMTLFPNAVTSGSNTFTARYGKDFGSLTSNNNHIGIHGNYGQLEGDCLATYYISNKSGEEKLILWEYALGASGDNAPDSFEASGKYTTKTGQITSFSATCGNGGFGAGSWIAVYGIADDTVSDEKTTLADGTRESTATKTAPTSGVLPTGTTTTDWTLVDATISSSNLNFNAGQQSTEVKGVYDLGSALSDTKWVVRFKYNITDHATGSNSNINAFVGLFSTTGNFSTTQDSINLGFMTDPNNNYFWAEAKADGGIDESTPSAGKLNTTPSETTYYVEIARTGTTTGKITLFSDSTYETELSSQTTFLNGVSSSITGLRYIGIKNRSNVPTLGSARWEGTISDIEVYDGVDAVVSTVSTAPPVGTRYEETDTRKIYRAGSLDPVFYYKFDEASGNVINHGSVANADLTVSGLTRDVSTPSGIGNGMSAPSNNSGDYAQNTSRINDYKFMHDGTTKWSVSFWLNLTSFAGSSSWTETYFFGNVWTDDNGIGWVIRMAYQSASVGKLQVFIANNTSSMPLNHSQSDMIPELNAWHHYTVTYDPTASSNQLTMTRDAATSGTGFAQTSTDNENWSTANPTRKVTFFARPTSSYDGGMAGKLAQVIIWKGHILTADEKTALYASGNGTTTLPSPLEWKERGSA